MCEIHVLHLQCDCGKQSMRSTHLFGLKKKQWQPEKNPAKPDTDNNNNNKK